MSPKSLRHNPFADPHPLTHVGSILYKNGGGGGGGISFLHYLLTFVPRCFIEACCIIPPREHPAQRNRVPRPRLPHRKRNHHSRILSALPERPPQRLQPEIESRSRHESRRSRRPPGPAFSRWTIPGPLRQRLGQPRHQVRTPPPGSFQFLSPRNRYPLRFAVAWPANSRRTPHSRRTHASFRRSQRRAVQPAAPDETRASARQSSAAPARHQGVSLRASFVWRRRVVWSCRIFRGEASGGNKRCHNFRRRRPHGASGKRLLRSSP